MDANYQYWQNHKLYCGKSENLNKIHYPTVKYNSDFTTGAEVH